MEIKNEELMEKINNFLNGGEPVVNELVNLALKTKNNPLLKKEFLRLSGMLTLLVLTVKSDEELFSRIETIFNSIFASGIIVGKNLNGE